MSHRDWLIFEDALRDPLLRGTFDSAFAQINGDCARSFSLGEGYPVCILINGQKILGTALLEYGLHRIHPAENADGARTFVEIMRALLGWGEISYSLRMWLEAHLCTPYFQNEGNDWRPVWVLRQAADTQHLPADIFRFACYVAIGELKHGPSYASVSANKIFDWVTKLGSDLPARLKKHGTGDLPVDLAQFRSPTLVAAANDALAVVRIVVKQGHEEAYRLALDYLIRLLTTTDFPRSYAIEFRSPTNVYLPISGLPRKGVHRLFACAAAYPALHPLIETYARAAMREFHWYQDLDDEDCAMPGTFAVFALGLADVRYAPLICTYLHLVDGEHQSMQDKFVEAYIDAHGFTAEAIRYLCACASNTQELPHVRPIPR